MSEVKFYFNDPIELEELSKTIELSFPLIKGVDWVSWIRWRFLENPNSDKAYIAYIKMDGKIVSCCTGTPYNINIDKEIPQKFIHTHTGFTHPAYQGLGLFQKTINALFKQLKEDGFVGDINFCNHNSHAGYRKIKERVELSVLNFFQTDTNLFRNKLLGSNVNNFEIVEDEVNDELLMKTTRMSFSTGDIHFSRDFAYLQWRLLKIPNKKYKHLSISSGGSLHAIIIYKDYMGMADIMEFFYYHDYEKVRYSLFALGVNYLLEAGIMKVNMWSNLHSNEHVELEKFGFQETTFCTYFGTIPFINVPELEQYKNWHYRFIDSDVF